MSEDVRPTVVITGAASGMGAASARIQAARGWRVHLLDRSEEVHEVAQSLVAADCQAIAGVVDVSNSTDVESAIRETISTFGRVDGLVNCAGIDGQNTRITEVEEHVLDRLLAVNLKGVLFTMRAVIPHMVSQGGGSIVNIASVSALIGIPHLTAYSASKGAVLSLSRAAAVELARKRVRVNTISPGMIHTKMFEESTNLDQAAALASGGGSPAGRLGTAEEIAEAIAYLLSPASGYTTGTDLVIDGGLSAR